MMIVKKYEELSDKYWNIDDSNQGYDAACWTNMYKDRLTKEIKDTFTLLKSLHKQIYYGK